MGMPVRVPAVAMSTPGRDESVRTSGLPRPSLFADAIGFRHCDEGRALLNVDHDAFEKWLLQLLDDVA